METPSPSGIDIFLTASCSKESIDPQNMPFLFPHSATSSTRKHSGSTLHVPSALHTPKLIPRVNPNPISNIFFISASFLTGPWIFGTETDTPVLSLPHSKTMVGKVVPLVITVNMPLLRPDELFRVVITISFPKKGEKYAPQSNNFKSTTKYMMILFANIAILNGLCFLMKEGRGGG